MCGQGEDTGYVVMAARPLLLREVANEMTAKLVVLRHDIEEEWLHVVVKGLGAKEEFGEETQILAVDGILATVDLEDGYRTISIDFISRRMLGRAFELMSPGDEVGTHVFETEFANVQHLISAVLFRVWRGIPGLYLEATKIDTFDLAGRPCKLLRSGFRFAIGL